MVYAICCATEIRYQTSTRTSTFLLQLLQYKFISYLKKIKDHKIKFGHRIMPIYFQSIVVLLQRTGLR